MDALSPKRLSNLEDLSRWVINQIRFQVRECIANTRSVSVSQFYSFIRYSRCFCSFGFTAFRSSINRNRIRDEREIHLQFMKSVSQESKIQVCPWVASRHGILSFYSPRALVNVRETERVLSDTEHRFLFKAHTKHCLDGKLSLCIAQNMVYSYAQFWDYNYGII